MTTENTKTYITDARAFVSENNTIHKLALKHIADNFCVTGRGEPRSYFTYHGWSDGQLDLEAGDYAEGGFNKREKFSEEDLEYLALQKINELWDDERHAFEKNKKQAARREWLATEGINRVNHFVKVFAKAFAVGCAIGGASNIIFAIIAKIKNRRNR